MAEYRIGDIGTFTGKIAENLGGSEFLLRIDDAEHRLKMLSTDPGGSEFLLDGRYHRVRYLEASTAELSMLVDGVPLTVNLHPGMDGIVYKNSGGGGSGGGGGTPTALKSQIPGKVVSIDAAEGAPVKKGDPVCTLESMKMQVGIKAHRDGTVKSVRVREGGNVAKNDVIAEIE